MAANAGHARIYKFNGSTWNQLGGDLEGDAAGDYFGWDVSIDGNGDTVAVSSQNNFTVKDFAKTHPEGAIGKRLLITVSKIMDKKNIPLIDQNSSFSSLLNRTIKSNFGLAIIINSQKHIIGVISDGDIKRIMKEKRNVDSIIIKQVMSKKPVVINQDMLAVEALSVLEENNIDAAPVVDSKQVIGVLTLKKVIKSIN